MISASKNFIHTSLNRFIDFLYPRVCFGCEEQIKTDNKWLCPQCIHQLYENNANRKACSQCGHNLTLNLCRCSSYPTDSYSKIYSLFDYEPVVHNIVHAFKYRGMMKLAFYMGKTFAHLFPKEIFATADIIIPIPLHFIRHTVRGYNQADWFAQGIYSGLSLLAPIHKRIITRVRYTKTQTRLTFQERQNNMQGAFRVKQSNVHVIQNKLCMIIDDVITTGATTQLCATELLKSGAQSVIIASLARTSRT